MHGAELQALNSGEVKAVNVRKSRERLSFRCSGTLAALAARDTTEQHVRRGMSLLAAAASPLLLALEAPPEVRLRWPAPAAPPRSSLAGSRPQAVHLPYRTDHDEQAA
mmetsp:Transcript_59570/g.109113  ORF Transcript_59570/g.109113 Transcript_59570/m.109113 type:complete len:108 (+) Transcript_59570:59-382(+)